MMFENAKHIHHDVLSNGFITYFHEGKIVECPFILHKTQDLNQSYFSKLVVVIQLVGQNGGFC